MGNSPNCWNFKIKQTNKFMEDIMTKTIKTTIVTLAASVALFLTGFLCTGFTTASAASADEGCNHAYEQTEIAATCTEQGYTLYTCTECGEEKKDN